MAIKIIYHKDCMDGIASAFIASETFKMYQESVSAIAVQYGGEDILFGRDPNKALKEPLAKEDVIYFVDFSLPRDLMIELSTMVKEIVVLDHHETAQSELEGLEEKLENVTVIFDMERSGATLAFDYFDPCIDGSIFDYIEDRDLWKFELDYSKEVNAAIKFYTKPNCLESFKETYERFDPVEFSNAGEVLLKQQDIQIKSKLKKVKDLSLKGISFKAINATENISELGNAICTEYNTPALVYFITEHDKVVCSLRSTDDLKAVEPVAKALGGGGHRNACGFTLELEDFMRIVLDRKDPLARLEELVMQWYKLKDVKPKTNWFSIHANTLYKNKELRVFDKSLQVENSEAHHIIYLTTTESTYEMFANAIEYFETENKLLEKKHLRR